MKISFGKYAGQDITTVPADYLEWLVDSSERTLEAVKQEILRRQQVESADMTTAERIVQAGFTALVKDAHPDTGGPADTAPEALKELHQAREFLRAFLRADRPQPAEEEPREPYKKSRRKGPQTSPPGPDSYWCSGCKAWHKYANRPTAAGR